MYRQRYLLILIPFMFFACVHEDEEAVYSIIPKPVLLEKGSGFYTFKKSSIICFQDSVLQTIANGLIAEIEAYTKPTVLEENPCPISLLLNLEWHKKERYSLKVSDKGVQIIGASPRAVFYGVQSLKQLMQSNTSGNSIRTPFVYIEDEPRFSYRGMHLDVARHMFPVKFIKKYIDLMAYHKFNTFHWHLTEDQGWRIEIKKYPKLQSIAAFRKETMNGHFTDKPRTFDGKEYGGYYSQEEIREIIDYASQRYVEVIPEIEMPGHSLAALSAYPELACTTGPFEAATTWGVFEDVYCPTEKTFEFLQNVLDEVAELFPSKYIHIGGDECPKTKWKESVFCQDLIKEEGLKDEHELQSYFIQRIEKYLNSKGKQIIGWDEILEGGLAPNATVMSWRGTQGGIEAAKSKHQVIMSPTSHCYFDYYQSKSEEEPIAIGGLLPLEKVYEFEPIPQELSQEEAKYIKGAQCNLWTEYIRTPDKAEYMVYPRACALAEVNWSRKESRSFHDFSSRLRDHLERLKVMNVNYADHYYDAKLNVEYDSIGVPTIDMTSNITEQSIYYTLDGSTPNKESQVFSKKLRLTKATQLRASSYIEEQGGFGRVQAFDFSPHLGTGEEISLVYQASETYKGLNGPSTLTDGVRGGKSFNGETWLGFSGKDLIANISFDEPKTIRQVTVGSLLAKDAWIYTPSRISIRAVTGSKEKHVASSLNQKAISDLDPRNLIINLDPILVSDLLIEIKNHGVIQKGDPGAGHESWLFVDEIIIE